MAYHNLSQRVKFAPSFDGVLANSTQNGASVDTLGFRRATAVINLFTGAATTANFQVQYSDDNTTWTSLTAGTLGTAIAASTADTGPYLVDIDLAKYQHRYWRVQIIGTGAAGNGAAQFALYEPFYQAVSQVQAAIIA